VVVTGTVVLSVCVVKNVFVKLSVVENVVVYGMTSVLVNV